ncbi:MAG: transporter substrate-binding domain-containing protein, partial [Paracoccaceae bacterium]|nr:transporter substrate-binding domain-containing protein [Paracoccaceae bacterium]
AAAPAVAEPASQWPELRVAVDATYKPFTYKTDSGELAGFDVDIAKALCDELKSKCVFVEQAWDGMIPGLQAKKYDVIISSMSITDERKEVIDFSEAYTQPDPSAFLATGEVDFSNAVIAAQSSTIQASYVTGMAGATLLEFATPDETIAAVKAGEADAVLADKAFLEPIAESDSEVSIVGEDVLIGGGIGLGVRQSDTELRDKFTAAIQSMKADGTLNELITKWLPGSATF